jgi:excisionase family DNA binding protein
MNPNDEIDHSFYCLSEAAAMAKIHPGVVRRWVSQGKIRAFGFRGAYRVRLSDLLPPVTPRRKAKDGK